MTRALNDWRKRLEEEFGVQHSFKLAQAIIEAEADVKNRAFAYWAKVSARAVQEEREACAKAAESWAKCLAPEGGLANDKISLRALELEAFAKSLRAGGTDT